MRRTVLICDDEPAVRFAIEEALEALGVDTISVGSAEEGLVRIAEADVVVGCDGIRSAIRASVFGGEGPRYAGTMCWRALAPTDALPKDFHNRHVNQWSGDGGFIISYYIRQGQFINFVCVRQQPGWTEQSWSVPSSVDEMLAALKDAGLYSIKYGVETADQDLLNEIKKNITVWVISFGLELNPVLANCAGPGKAFSAKDAATLNNVFTKIAEAMGDLRISK